MPTVPKRSCYSTLEAIKRAGQITETNWDVWLGDMIHQLSRQIDEYCHRHFYELSATKYYDLQDTQRLRLDEELLAITTFTNGNSETLVSGTDFIPYPLDGPPYLWLDVKRDSGSSFTFSGTTQKALSIEGKWGYHPDYAAAWYSTGDSVQNAAGITASASTMTVTSGDNFDVYETVKVDSEQMLITAINGVTLSIERAINGTTAAAHDNGDAISTWVVPGIVSRSCAVWIVFLLNTGPDSGISRLRMGDYEEAVSFFLLDQMRQGPPADVEPALKALQRREYWWKK